MPLTPILGVLGGLCFGFAAVPQAVATIRARRHLGTPMSIILAVFYGTLLMYAYLTARNGFDPLLTGIYAVEASSWAVLLAYRVRA